MGLGRRISELLRKTPPDRRLEALYDPLQAQALRAREAGVQEQEGSAASSERAGPPPSCHRGLKGPNRRKPVMPESNTSTRRVIHDEKGEREKEGEHVIKLILMTLIRRFGSTANDSIKIMTLGLFCHHLGSFPLPCHCISRVLAMTTGQGDRQDRRDGD